MAVGGESVVDNSLAVVEVVNLEVDLEYSLGCLVVGNVEYLVDPWDNCSLRVEDEQVYEVVLEVDH